MFCLYALFFDTQILMSQTAERLVLGRPGKIHSDISPIPPVNFTGGSGGKSEKFQIWPRFTIPLMCSDFETGQYIGNLHEGQVITLPFDHHHHHHHHHHFSVA